MRSRARSPSGRARCPSTSSQTAVKELDGTSGTAEYGPPYNHNSGSVQHFLFLHPQRWLGVSHPINTAEDYVVEPLKKRPQQPDAAERRSPNTKRRPKSSKRNGRKPTPSRWKNTGRPKKKTSRPEHRVGRPERRSVTWPPRPARCTMMAGLLASPRAAASTASLLTSGQFFQTDYTKPLLFMADGGLLDKRAEEQHLLGEQWGMMNETGSYPGQVWLWLYTLWYQVEPIKSSAERGPAGDADHGPAQHRVHPASPSSPASDDLPRWIPHLQA